MPENVAVLEREKRKTAGRRMSALVGQAAKNDEEFWTHSTWKDANDGGNDVASDDDSFHDSDEESEAKVDTFDSDFDDSENDDDDGTEGGEEEEVLREEKRDKARKRAEKGKQKMFDIVNAGRELMQKRKNSAQRKRALRGDDVNAGLILNMPGAAPIVRNINRRIHVKTNGSNSTATAATPIVVAPPAPLVAKQSNTTSTVLPTRRSSRSKTQKFSVAEVVSGTFGGTKRSLRTSTLNNTIETSTNTSARQEQTQTRTKNEQQLSSSKPKSKRRYTQEELLIEAVEKTEAENQRWLLGRKRMMVEESIKADMEKKFGGQRKSVVKVVEKFNSRRGCFNTLTFPEMDHVPEIFTRGSTRSRASASIDSTNGKKNTKDLDWRLLEIDRVRKENTCVITGKRARYRDPKSNMGYHDLDAFRELRRRLDAGEPLIKKVVKKEKVNATVPGDGQLSAAATAKASAKATTTTTATQVKSHATSNAPRKESAVGVSSKSRKESSCNLSSKVKKGKAKVKMETTPNTPASTTIVTEKGQKASPTKLAKVKPKATPNAPTSTTIVTEKGQKTSSTKAAKVKTKATPSAPTSATIVTEKGQKASSTKAKSTTPTKEATSSTSKKPKTSQVNKSTTANKKVNGVTGSKSTSDSQTKKGVITKRKLSTSKTSATPAKKSKTTIDAGKVNGNPSISAKKSKTNSDTTEGSGKSLESHPQIINENGQKKAVSKNDKETPSGDLGKSNADAKANIIPMAPKSSQSKKDGKQTTSSGMAKKASTSGDILPTAPKSSQNISKPKKDGEQIASSLVAKKTSTSGDMRVVNNTNMTSISGTATAINATRTIPNASTSITNIRNYQPQPIHPVSNPGIMNINPVTLGGASSNTVPSISSMLQAQLAGQQHLAGSQTALSQYANTLNQIQHLQQYPSMYSSPMMNVNHAMTAYMRQPTQYQHNPTPTTTMFSTGNGSVDMASMLAMNLATANQALPQMASNIRTNPNIQMEAPPTTTHALSQLQNNLRQHHNGGIIPMMNLSSSSSLMQPHQQLPTSLNRSSQQQKPAENREKEPATKR